MSCRDDSKAVLISLGIQPFVPQFAGSFFNALLVLPGVFAHVSTNAEEFQPAFARQVGDKALVSVGLCAAQLVIDVGDGKDDSKLSTKFDQDSQQCDGVGSAGDGNGHAVSCMEKIAIADAVEDLVAHRSEERRVGKECRSRWS